MKVADRGDVFWVNPNPAKGREMKDLHRFVAISPREINRFGLTIMVAITSGGEGARDMGITVSIQGHDTLGVAVCNQVRSFDLRSSDRQAKFIETLDEVTTNEIINRVVSIIDPDQE